MKNKSIITKELLNYIYENYRGTFKELNDEFNLNDEQIIDLYTANIIRVFQNTDGTRTWRISKSQEKKGDILNSELQWKTKSLFQKIECFVHYYLVKKPVIIKKRKIQKWKEENNRI